ncbi:EAL domain-containing protein [Sulfurimonas sp.]|uniref:sensor domain-containing protein n=1 Tax=Sulfurimonas sp. TaxID=2022749 RepID=UPI00356A03CB
MVRRLSQSASYVLAFAILVLWASFAFYTMHSLIDSQKKFGKLINLSGKQRMLSQKTTLHVHMIEETGTGIERLKELIGIMKADHSFITSNLTSEKIKEYYFKENGLDSQVKNYFNLLDTFLADRNDKNIILITNNSFALLKNLDKAVKMFEQEYDQIVVHAKERELYIYIGTILTLILEAIFIIIPMIRANKKYVNNLEKEVKKRTKDIEIFEKIFNNSKEGMVITDSEEKILNVNKAFSEITGYSKDEALGETPRVLQSKKHNKEFYEKMWDDIESKNIWQGEIVNKRKNGKEVNEHLTIMKLKDENSHNYVSVFSDITLDKQNQEKLKYLATHDSLTGLFSRSEILNKIEKAINESKKEDKTFALVFIDLDNFKEINDSMGHSLGDKLLVNVAKRIKSIKNESDFVARIGGDEFVILLAPSTNQIHTNIFIDKLHNIFIEPFVIDNKELYTTVSAGIVYYEKDDSSALSLLRKADLAMYSAKDKGKNKTFYYTKDLEENLQSKLTVEKRLREAIEKDELELYFQPKVNFSTAKIYAAEVLLRWIKDGEIIPPDTFIYIAEESNLIKKIDQWVMEKAIERVREIHSLGFNDFYLAVNISGHTFSDIRYMKNILNTIEQSNMAKYIEIELTEGALIENIDIATKHLEEIKKLGISVSLDDFGTGYSSFSYLSQMNIDVLKIDRSFIMNLEDKKQEVIVKSIISFSNNLGLKVVAEGVETQTQSDWLKMHGCHYGQGYLYGKPMPFEEFTKHLA